MNVLRSGVIIFILIVLSACSNEEADNDHNSKANVNETGMPIVEEPITLEMFVPVDPDGFDEWEDILVWETYEDLTNVHIEWDKVAAEAQEEKRNLALGSNNMPDVFYASGMPVMDLMKHGEQGTFIELNDLIEEYAPNLSQLMEENPEIRKSLTFPNGKIYSMPTILAPDAKSLRIGARPWINEAWLEELDMSIPETTDEFYDYLRAVQDSDLMGDGEDSEIPFGAQGIDEIVSWLKGSFGVGSTGHSYLDIDPDSGDLRFFPITDEYKQMITYIRKLYDEELIEQNIFSIDVDQFRANGTEGLYGSTVYYDPTLLFGDGGENFVGAHALEGPNGDKEYVAIGQLVTQFGAFVITNENENPEAAVRWMDHFYSDEGIELMFMGVEGETFTKTDDGESEYIDDILNSPDGLTFEQELAKYVPWVNVYAPAMFKQEFFQGSESSPLSLEAAETLEPYLPEETWPVFTYTEEENKRLSTLESDIGKYVEEARDLFISGNIDMSEWDDYVNKIEKMGLEEYMDIQKEAYDRYKSN